jgi:decaprenylphospho-beta-D-erythro-pentofuranosid-2-ulose 2-reductase
LNILIIGAASAIAKATARIYAEQGHDLFLLGRNEETLAEIKEDLKVRGANSTGSVCLDLTKSAEHESAVQQSIESMGELDVALICHGSLPDQQRAEVDYRLAKKEIDTNGLSVISLLTVLSQRLSEQQRGTIAVITSVAGDRGRQPNFVYGAAKSLVSTYLQGLRGKLLDSNVHVIDIRPGLVDSPMTAHMEKGALWSSPERVAQKIVSSITKKKHTVYVPGYWRAILFVVRLIPEFIFKRLKF